MSEMNNLPIIGRNTHITFLDENIEVPAKVDTGADSSSVWVSGVYVDTNHALHFKLFNTESQYYTGREYTAREYTVSRVRSSNGHEQIRYRAKLSAVVTGKKIKIVFTLADRSKNFFPVLIGRRTLANKFLVDVAKGELESVTRSKSSPLKDEFAQNPHEFYKKYHQNEEKK